MFPRAAKLIIRALAEAGAATWVLVTCTAASGQVAERPTAVPQRGTPTVAATVAPTAAPDRRAMCEDYVAVLSGRKHDAGLLEDPAVLALAGQAPEVATCAAIGKDSEELCMNQGCRKLLRLFHELRAYPKGRSFLLPECYKMADKEWEAFCGSMLKALRSGDESQCATTGDAATLCRAFVKMDPKLCVPVKGLPDDLPSACKERIQAWGPLAKGLKGMEESGAPPALAKELDDAADLQAFAKSALGRSDACASFDRAAMDLCMKGGSPAAPGSTPPSTPGAKPADSPPAAQSSGVKPSQPEAVSQRNR